MRKKQELENKIIGDDLCKFVQLLVENKICEDVGQIDAAGKNCSKTATENFWGYTSSINMNIDSMGSTLPNDASSLQLTLTIDIKGLTKVSTEYYDPLEKLFFDIEIIGLSKERGDIYCSWHLDRHQPQPGDNKEHYSHPKYHFTFGGKKMEKKNLSYGSALIFPTPRFVFPPMDAVLGIDFILQNYIHKSKLQNLITDPNYYGIVRKSQERLWKPFFGSLYSFYDSKNFNISADFTPTMLLPLYY
jgi:hypothetical protein